jgi:hypothetical protein
MRMNIPMWLYVIRGFTKATCLPYTRTRAAQNASRSAGTYRQMLTLKHTENSEHGARAKNSV